MVKPPLFRNLLVKSRYVNPFRNSYLQETLHSLPDKQATELVKVQNLWSFTTASSWSSSNYKWHPIFFFFLHITSYICHLYIAYTFTCTDLKDYDNTHKYFKNYLLIFNFWKNKKLVPTFIHNLLKSFSIKTAKYCSSQYVC